MNSLILLLSGCFQDMTGAAQHLRHAKGLDPMISAAKSGLPVDITKVKNALSKSKLAHWNCKCICTWRKHQVKPEYLELCVRACVWVSSVSSLSHYWYFISIPLIPYDFFFFCFAIVCHCFISLYFFMTQSHCVITKNTVCVSVVLSFCLLAGYHASVEAV